MSIPALLHAQAGRILSLLNALRDRAQTNIVGAAVSDGGTTQGSGASTAPNFDVDVTALLDLSVGGVAHPAGLAAATDAVATGGDGLDWGATSGKSAVLALVVSTGSANDTPAYAVVQGAVADSGQQIPPTDAEIATSLGHSNFARVADCTLARTGDTTITIAIDHDVRNAVANFAALSTDVGFR